ncbi:hypothetical protein OSTOST_25023, partial [Ostertagia ostertagi]
MVPCFDEPAFKATWAVTLIHPQGTTALSNGKEISSEKDSNGPWMVSKFATTPKMSSYLLAVVVGEFKSVEGHTNTGVRFRIWSRPGAIHRTSYALDIGMKCLDFYESHFGIKYPLEK